MNVMTRIARYRDHDSQGSLTNVYRNAANLRVAKITAERDMYLAEVGGSGGEPHPPSRPVGAQSLPVLDAAAVRKRLIALMASVADPTSTDREEAARELGRRCSAQGTPPLCRDVVVPLLCSMVKNGSSVAAAGALGAIGDIRAVRPLLMMMSHGARGLLGLYYMAKLALYKFRNLLPMLIGIIKNDHRGSDVEEQASCVLGNECGKTGAPALCKTSVVPLLITRLQKNATAGMSAKALGEIGDKTAVPALLRALEKGDGDIRAKAAYALGQLKDVRAVMPLCARLQDDDYRVKAYAAVALGALRDARAVRALIRVLDDESDDVRWRAASALGAIGDRRAIPALKLAKNDSDANVRKAAAEALLKIQKGNRPYVTIPQ